MRKATIKKAVDVRSNDLAQRRRDCCMFLYQWCEERRSLRPSENKQASESNDTKNQNSIPVCYCGVLTR
ncbi:hypothetical protein KCP75_11365 [Salmonella enterica subsp. enterica]|nr:hypothetical protein KCP75_11365 [Salmonella enterica subsp. enterica]